MRRALQAWNCDGVLQAWHCEEGVYRPGIVRRVLQAWHCKEGVTGQALWGGVTGLAL